MTIPPPPAASVASQPGPLPSAPASPPRRRPSKAWYGVAGILAAAGIALGSWGVWTGTASFRAIGDFTRVDVPGHAEITLEAGSYTVYYETSGIAGNEQRDDAFQDDVFDENANEVTGTPPPVLDITMEPIGDAQPVALRPRLTSSTYQIGGPSGSREGLSMWQFQLDRAGSYEVTVAAEGDGGPPTTVAIGPGIGRGLIGMLLALFASFGIVLLAGLMAGVTALVRHARRPVPASGALAAPEPPGR